MKPAAENNTLNPISGGGQKAFWEMQEMKKVNYIIHFLK